MAGTVVADTLQADSTSTLVIKNGVANTPPTVQDSAGTQIGTFCRAWVNFNGTSTVAIRSDFNVTDITDNGTGDYTVNIDVDMPDANYSLVCSARGNGNAGRGGGALIDAPKTGTTPTTSAVTLTIGIGATATANGELYDSDYVAVAIFR